MKIFFIFENAEHFKESCRCHAIASLLAPFLSCQWLRSKCRKAWALARVRFVRSFPFTHAHTHAPICVCVRVFIEEAHASHPSGIASRSLGFSPLHSGHSVARSSRDESEAKHQVATKNNYSEKNIYDDVNWGENITKKLRKILKNSNKLSVVQFLSLKSTNTFEKHLQRHIVDTMAVENNSNGE